jgi:hypothetical protein
LGRLVAVRRARLGLTQADLLGVDRRTEGLRSTFGARWLSRWDGTLADAPPSPRGARHTLTAQPAKPLDHIRSRRADRTDRDHRAGSDHG